MQGVAGTYGGPDKRTTKRMLDEIWHRGPDRTMLRDDDRGTLGAVCAGRGRPIADEGGVAVACDIALFNRAELASRFLKGRDRFTDNELLLAMYRRLGVGMFKQLQGGFAIAVSDRGRTVLARDPYGLKPLYISKGLRQGAFSSEIKSQVLHGDEFVTFPPGKTFVSGKGFTSYGRRTGGRRRPNLGGRDLARTVREAAVRAVSAVKGADDAFNILLSGGLDSSSVAVAASEVASTLDTVCVGTEDSPDMPMARRVAAAIGSNHRERIYDVEDMFESLDDVIYHSETFDMPLVRSCIPNLMATRMFEGTGRVTLCGEGGDEVFAGYDYLRHIRGDAALRRERVSLLEGGHATGFQRVDRMMAAASLDGRMPLMSPEVVSIGLSLGRRRLIGPKPADSKLALKAAFKDALPAPVIARRKRRFSDGAGSIRALAGMADDIITDREFERESRALPKGRIRTKEELLYFRSFAKHFDSPSAVASVGYTPRP